MVNSHDLTSIFEFLIAMGQEPRQQNLQILGSGEIVEAEAAAPFESGMIAVSPLRSLLVRLDEAESDHGRRSHVDAVTRFLVSFMGSDEEEITVGNGDGLAICLVHELPAMDSPSWVLVLAGDEFGGGQEDPRAMHRIVARLRAPDGCPWDRKQDHASLAKNMVDEVYETVDAIERGDMGNLAEELGDLYLLILMQAQIAHEADEFSIEDVYRGITSKIIGRHPHVFGDDAASSAEEVVGIWQQVKAKERADSGKSSGKDVDGEPFSMPALTRATRVLKKHPLDNGDDIPPLLREVAAIIAAGNDPEAVLREQLRQHASNNS